MDWNSQLTVDISDIPLDVSPQTRKMNNTHQLTPSPFGKHIRRRLSLTETPTPISGAKLTPVAQYEPPMCALFTDIDSPSDKDSPRVSGKEPGRRIFGRLKTFPMQPIDKENMISPM
eukprot:Ihof_evm4s629 gene=Ihof_evmTU4s629